MLKTAKRIASSEGMHRDTRNSFHDQGVIWQRALIILSKSDFPTCAVG